MSAIEVNLYNTSDGANVLNKSLTSIGTPHCEVYDATDILRPTMLIDHLGVTETSNVNYCYIPVFNRYYFATVVIHKQQAFINCVVDPLMSWKNSIKDINAHVVRQENEGLSYLYDERLPVPTKKIIEHKLISNDMYQHFDGDNKSRKLLLLQVI